MTQRVAVLIRVFDRVDDLALNLQVIRGLWTRYAYHIIVVFNGTSSGIRLPPGIETLCDQLISLPHNAGHIQGNAQLLREGVPAIPPDCDYTVLLEADTWLMGDEIIEQYIGRMSVQSAEWASAEWVEKYWSLAVDFAVTRSSLLKQAYDVLLNYETRAEAWVAEYLLSRRISFLQIKELMPVHVPASMRFLGVGYAGRFRLFPAGRMVTHHVEELVGGMNAKRELADVAYGRPFLAENSLAVCKWRHFTYQVLMVAAKYAPRSSWFRQKKMLQVFSG